jgi:cellulose biosynthesis protein BcsQ
VLIPVSTEKMAVRTVPLILDQIDEVRESELNVHLRAWYILATLYDSRETEATKSLQELRASYNSLVYPTPVARRTNYKKAVREHVDVGDLDTEQGVFWDTLAAQLIAESEKEHSHA